MLAHSPAGLPTRWRSIWRRVVSAQRPIAKATTYRMIAMCMDFAAIYPFTGKVRDAIGLMIASNVYTTVAYVIHDRAWARATWAPWAHRRQNAGTRGNGDRCSCPAIRLSDGAGQLD